MAWGASLFSRKMAKNPQTPLLSFEDLRPYIKLLGKNWWMMLAFAGVGYGTGRLVTHQMVDIHRATSEILINQSEGSGVDAMLAGRSGVRSFNYYNDEVQNQLRVLRSYDLVGRAIGKIADHVDYHLVGRIKEMPVQGFSAITVEANVKGFAPKLPNKPPREPSTAAVTPASAPAFTSISSTSNFSSLLGGMSPSPIFWSP